MQLPVHCELLAYWNAVKGSVQLVLISQFMETPEVEIKSVTTPACSSLRLLVPPPNV